jgi:hypothetical protein
MKKLVCLTLIVLGASVSASCATPDSVPTPNQTINPGDKVGDFLITTGDAEGTTYVCMLHCPFDESTKTESCEFPVGTKVNVGPGFYDDPATGGTLDEEWPQQTYKMVIAGRPVNLQAFGSIDITHSIVGKVRNWNVVIVADKPGKIAAHSTGEYNSEPIEYTASLTFSAP